MERANRIERLIEGNKEILCGTGKALEYLRAVSGKRDSLEEDPENVKYFGIGVYRAIVDIMGDVLDELNDWRALTWGSKNKTDIKKGQIYRDILDLSKEYRRDLTILKKQKELEEERKEDELEEQRRRAEREEKGLPSWGFTLIDNSGNSNQVSNSNTSQ